MEMTVQEVLETIAVQQISIQRLEREKERLTKENTELRAQLDAVQSQAPEKPLEVGEKKEVKVEVSAGQ